MANYKFFGSSRCTSNAIQESSFSLLFFFFKKKTRTFLTLNGEGKIVVELSLVSIIYLSKVSEMIFALRISLLLPHNRSKLLVVVTCELS